MALDYSGLTQAPTFGQSFMAGRQAAQEQAERNLLRQAQMGQMQAQRENMLAQRQEREALATQRTQETARKAADAERRRVFLSGLNAQLQQNGYRLDRPTLGQILSEGMQTGEERLVKLATEGIRALDDEERDVAELARIQGGAPAARMPGAPAAPAAAAPVTAPAGELLAGTPFATGMNALAARPAPPEAVAAPAPTEPMVGGFTRGQIEQMVASTSPRIKARGEALAKLLPKEAEPTVGMREYQEAVRQGFKGTFMEYKQSFVPKPPQVSVKLPDQEKAFETGLGRAQAERIMEDQKVAQDARGIIDTVQQGRQLLQSGAITGFGAEALTQIGSALNQIGINFAEDAVANTQAFAANMAQNVGRIIKQFGAGTGLSNADREYAEKMAGGKITLDRKAIERILDINERAARNVIVSHNRRVQGIKTNVPLTVEMPPGPPAAAPIPGAPAAAAPAAAPAAAAPVYARNPTTGARIMSTDGGRTWNPVR